MSDESDKTLKEKLDEEKKARKLTKEAKKLKEEQEKAQIEKEKREKTEKDKTQRELRAVQRENNKDTSSSKDDTVRPTESENSEEVDNPLENSNLFQSAEEEEILILEDSEGDENNAKGDEIENLEERTRLR